MGWYRPTIVTTCKGSYTLALLKHMKWFYVSKRAISMIRIKIQSFLIKEGYLQSYNYALESFCSYFLESTWVMMLRIR